MPTTYTGDGTATQSPSPTPAAGSPPQAVLPVDGDGATAASVAQAFKVLADFIAWLLAPFANASAWIQAIVRWRNARLQTRALISHPGFFEGKVLSWQEDWQDVAMAPKTAVGNGAFGGRWFYSISGDAVGGHVEPDAPPSDPPALGSADSDIRASCIYLVSNTGGSAANFEEIETPAQIIVDDDSCFALQWDAKVHTSGSGNNEDAGGLIAVPLLGSTAPLTVANPGGIAFHRSPSDGNWHIYYNTFAGPPGDVNTGVAVGGRQRFRIEYYGANVSDDSTARALFYINGALVTGGNIALSLTSGGPSPFSLRAFFRHFDVASLSWMNVQTVDFRANTWAGDVAF